MRTTFLRRTTLHVSQRRLTEARTFMKKRRDVSNNAGEIAPEKKDHQLK